MTCEAHKSEHKSKRLGLVAKQFPLDQPSIRDQFYICDEVFDSISFHEELLIVDIETDEQLGTVTISVKPVGEDRKFLQVRSVAQAKINGNQCGIKIVSCVNRHFDTIEEKRQEYAIPLDGTNGDAYPVTKSLYIGQDKDSYHCSVKLEHKEAGHVDKKTTRIPLQYTKNLVAEGANLLLLRHLSITGYQGNIQLLGMHIDGHLRFATYVCAGIEKQKINKKYEQVVVIERIIRSTHDEEDRMVTTLAAKTGQELDHVWIGWPYMYRIHTSQIVAQSISDGIVHSTLPLHQRWEEDLEMMSLYLDKKVRQRALHYSYLLDKPELRDILSDYVQALLLQKPYYVIAFSIKFFQAFQYNPEYAEVYCDPQVGTTESLPEANEE